jgi:hypothetical protein
VSKKWEWRILTAIRGIIEKIIEKMAHRNGYKKAWLEKYWVELVGEEAGKHCKPYKIDRDILYVNVDSSVWNQELFMNRANLVLKINQKFCRKMVEAVKYQIGYLPVIDEGLDSSGKDILSNEPVSVISREAIWDKELMNRLQRKKEEVIARRKIKE